MELLPPQGRQRERPPARSRGGGSGSGEGGGGSLALALDESRRPRRGPFELPSLRLELEDGAVEVGDAVGVGVVGGAAAVWESRERERESWEEEEEEEEKEEVRETAKRTINGPPGTKREPRPLGSLPRLRRGIKSPRRDVNAGSLYIFAAHLVLGLEASPLE